MFKSGGINIFWSPQSTWMSLTLTHGDSRRTLARLWLVQIITWWSCDNKCWDSRLIAHKSPHPILSSFKTADVIKSCLKHRIPYQTGPNHLSPQVEPVQQTEYRGSWTPCDSWQKFWQSEFCVCFSLSLTALTLSIWFHNVSTTTRSNFWLLCSVHVLWHFQAISAQLVNLPSPCLWLNPNYGLVFIQDHGLLLYSITPKMFHGRDWCAIKGHVFKKAYLLEENTTMLKEDNIFGWLFFSFFFFF